MSIRTLQQVIRSLPASDGAGVKLRRSLGQSQGLRVDPFLMLDEFFSDNPADYIAGFPSHPHRGFETVTYMLDGHLLHEDHLGHQGHLKSGGAQWMTAGRGIIHSEMPQQESGRLRGFQLWINLPAKEKMKPAAYRDIQAEEIPRVALPDGTVVKVIAGTLVAEAGAMEGTSAEGTAAGPATSVAGPVQGLSTAPLFFDVSLPAGGRFRHPLPAAHAAFVYPYEGRLAVGEDGRPVPAHDAGVLSPGEQVLLTAGDDGARFLLLAAQPLREPIVQYGPFVMNTREEIDQAISDYQNGRLA